MPRRGGEKLAYDDKDASRAGIAAACSVHRSGDGPDFAGYQCAKRARLLPPQWSAPLLDGLDAGISFRLDSGKVPVLRVDCRCPFCIERRDAQRFPCRIRFTSTPTRCSNADRSAPSRCFQPLAAETRAASSLLDVKESACCGRGSSGRFLRSLSFIFY